MVVSLILSVGCDYFAVSFLAFSLYLSQMPGLTRWAFAIYYSKRSPDDPHQKAFVLIFL